MGKTRLNKDIVLNFCNTDYSGTSCYVEEELHSSYAVLQKYCNKYKLDLGSVIPIYEGPALVLNAVVTEPGTSCSGAMLKIIVKEIKRLSKEGSVRFFQKNIHIHQKLPDKIKDYLIRKLSDFTLTFH